MSPTNYRLRVWLLLCLPWSAAIADNSPTDAAGWLVKMSRSAQTLNYDGTFVYLHDRKLESMRVIHQAKGGNEYERLISLNGSSREVIRNGDVVTCVLPNAKRVVVDKNDKINAFPIAFSTEVDEARKFYNFKLEGADRVAGFKARVVSIKPVDRYRYGYRLWMDEKSGLLLKSELIGGDGQPIEQMMFTNLKIVDSIPDSLIKSKAENDDYTWIAEETTAEMPIDKGWQFGWLPKGFRVSEHYKRRLSTTGTPVDHMILTDGFSMVSVFVESIDAKRIGGAGASKKGAINAYTTLFGDHRITAVGEVPAVTVSQIVDSMEYHPMNGIKNAAAND